MRLRLPALVVSLGLVLAPLAPALAAEGRSFPDPATGIREDTPNDPGFDCSEPDDEDAGEVESCGSIWDAQPTFWGFAPDSTRRSAVHRRVRGPASPCAPASAWTRPGRPASGGPTSPSPSSTPASRWDSPELRQQVALNAAELPAVPTPTATGS
jgi:hypothetical protein